MIQIDAWSPLSTGPLARFPAADSRALIHVPAPPQSSALQRWRLSLQGRVQGVGFRPFACRLARELRLAGWVKNTGQGLLIEIEGRADSLLNFRRDLLESAPAAALISRLNTEVKSPQGGMGFAIHPSDHRDSTTTFIPPDLATCPECLTELFDPANRRHLYPFTNCTQCGPRYSILHRLPYDRPATTMRAFVMCAECRREYEDPGDRRFHAQPNACPRCGPQLDLCDDSGGSRASRQDALDEAAGVLREGCILALKGLGGFQLLVDAANDDAVLRLRQRKHRPAKPFALMVADIHQAGLLCHVTTPEQDLLRSPAAPIVLLQVRDDAPCQVSSRVAPGQPNLGLMLPCTPLHHLLLRQFDRPVVATSGNLSDEPICIDTLEALDRLRGVADLFLVHDRAIARPVDDSVARMIDGQPVVLRAARGYAPLALEVDHDVSGWLAAGGQEKNTVALGVGRHIVVSQHIGSLQSPLSRDFWDDTIRDLSELHQTPVKHVACDAHPDYASTRGAMEMSQPPVTVQHHHAHLVACLVDQGLDPRETVLGICWDGTGWGGDGTVWGGEFLRGNARDVTRVASLRPFLVPGGEEAVMEPRRSALGLLHAVHGPSLFDLPNNPAVASFPPSQRKALRKVLEKNIHCFATTSAGRLFDGVASLLGLSQRVTFEGEAALQVEAAAQTAVDESLSPLPYGLIPADDRVGMIWADWMPLVRHIVEAVAEGVDSRVLAARFHRTLAAMALEVARQAGVDRVLLSGGCFQNKLLTELICRELRAQGFDVRLHRRLPPNDGGLAPGQLIAAVHQDKHAV